MFRGCDYYAKDKGLSAKAACHSWLRLPKSEQKKYIREATKHKLRNQLFVIEREQETGVAPPPNALQLYEEHRLKQLADRDPLDLFHFRSDVVKTEWQGMSRHEREPFVTKAKQAKAEYQTRIGFVQDSRANPSKIIKTAPLRYREARLQAVREAGGPIGRVHALISVEWHNMSDADKAPWLAAVAAEEAALKIANPLLYEEYLRRVEHSRVREQIFATKREVQSDLVARGLAQPPRRRGNKKSRPNCSTIPCLAAGAVLSKALHAGNNKLTSVATIAALSRHISATADGKKRAQHSNESSASSCGGAAKGSGCHVDVAALDFADSSDNVLNLSFDTTATVSAAATDVDMTTPTGLATAGYLAATAVSAATAATAVSAASDSATPSPTTPTTTPTTTLTTTTNSYGLRGTQGLHEMLDEMAAASASASASASPLSPYFPIAGATTTTAAATATTTNALGASDTDVVMSEADDRAGADSGSGSGGASGGGSSSGRSLLGRVPYPVAAGGVYNPTSSYNSTTNNTTSNIYSLSGPMTESALATGAIESVTESVSETVTESCDPNTPTTKRNKRKRSDYDESENDNYNDNDNDNDSDGSGNGNDSSDSDDSNSVSATADVDTAMAEASAVVGAAACAPVVSVAKELEKRQKAATAAAVADATATKAPPAKRKRRQWTEDEEVVFLNALEEHGRDWKAVSAALGGSRDVRSVKSHAQKHFIKLYRECRPLPEAVAASGDGYTLSGAPLKEDSAAARTYLRTDVKWRTSAATVPSVDGSTATATPSRASGFSSATASGRGSSRGSNCGGGSNRGSSVSPIPTPAVPTMQLGFCGDVTMSTPGNSGAPAGFATTGPYTPSGLMAQAAAASQTSQLLAGYGSSSGSGADTDCATHSALFFGAVGGATDLTFGTVGAVSGAESGSGSADSVVPHSPPGTTNSTPPPTAMTSSNVEFESFFEGL